MNESYTSVANKTSINGCFQLSHRKQNTKIRELVQYMIERNHDDD